jgi:2-methylcitrate dehydratase PrpD
VAVNMAKKYDIKPENIESIVATVAPVNKNYPGGDFHGPFATLDQALLSKPFSLATAMMYRNITVDMYLSRLNAPEIQQLAQKVSSRGKEGMGFLDYRIDVKLKDGTTVSGDHTLANMKNYSLDPKMETEKFCRLTSNLLAKEDALKIVQTIFQIKDMPDLTALSAMLKKTKTK